MVLENTLKPSDHSCSEETPLNLRCGVTGHIRSNGATAVIVQNSDGESWPNDQSDVGSWYSVNTSASSSESIKMGSTEYIKMDDSNEVMFYFYIVLSQTKAWQVKNTWLLVLCKSDVHDRVFLVFNQMTGFTAVLEFLEF